VNPGLRRFPGSDIKPAMAPILNVSFYRFTRLSDLSSLRDRVKAQAISAGLHGSILLSEEGINGFLAGEESRIRAYLEWLFVEVPGLAGLKPKESYSADIPFTRMLVKIKKEIITMGRPEVMPSEKTGRSLAPKELKRWYDEKKDFVIVDTRNDYEISQGAFDNAVHYDIETFRQFPEKLSQEVTTLRDKTVVMYCTGGIRCEKATALAMDLGIKDVYQLEGGILKYFEEVGGSHYSGECFVFDHRAAVDPGLEALPERKLREKVSGLKLEYAEGAFAGVQAELAMQAKSLPFEKIETDPASLRSEVILRHGERVLQNPSAIFEYLEEHFPETRALSPTSEERMTRLASWIKWAEGAFTTDAAEWIEVRETLTHDESHALEVKLEKHLYRIKTPLQRNRRFLVIDDLTAADLAVYAVLRPLSEADFPRDYPERFALVWDWMAEVEAAVQAGHVPVPKILRRPGDAVWPN
jgi:UPF0176 protein